MGWLGAFDGWPPWLVVFLVAMVPIVEMRGAVPLGMILYGMSVWEAVFWSVLGNFLFVPPLLLFLGPAERRLRRIPWWDRFFTRLFDRTLRKLPEKRKRFEAAGLVVLVGIPLPGTGAWSGAILGHVLGLGYTRSLVAIALGILMAALIIATIVASGEALWLLGQ